MSERPCALVVLPAAPALVPDVRGDPVPELDAVTQAAREVLDGQLAGVSDVVIVAARDVVRDRSGPTVAESAAHAWAVADAILDQVDYGGLRRRAVAGQRVSWSSDALGIFMADGSASVGPRAPRPTQDGAPFDEHIDQVLRAGNLMELATLDDTDALAVGCVTAAVWRALAQAATGCTEVQVLDSFAPYGVRYWVGAWSNRTTRQ